MLLFALISLVSAVLETMNCCSLTTVQEDSLLISHNPGGWPSALLLCVEW